MGARVSRRGLGGGFGVRDGLAGVPRQGCGPKAEGKRPTADPPCIVRF